MGMKMGMGMGIKMGVKMVARTFLENENRTMVMEELQKWKGNSLKENENPGRS